MNRREFLKSFFAATTLAAISNEIFIESILQETIHYTDDEFVYYIKWQFKMLVKNPDKCSYIDGITTDGN